MASSPDEHGIMGTSDPHSFRTCVSTSWTHGMPEHAGDDSEHGLLSSWFFCQAAKKFALSTSATVSGRVGAELEEKEDEATTSLSSLSTTCNGKLNIFIKEMKEDT